LVGCIRIGLYKRITFIYEIFAMTVYKQKLQTKKFNFKCKSKPGFLVDFVPAFWGKNTPVPPHDPCPETKKTACIPGPPVACLGLWYDDDLAVNFERWSKHNIFQFQIHQNENGEETIKLFTR